MNAPAVSRWLRGFDGKRGELQVEYLLPAAWTLVRLRELFNASEDDPMFDSYPLGPVQTKVLGEDLGLDLFGPEELTFFLEADAED